MRSFGLVPLAIALVIVPSSAAAVAGATTSCSVDFRARNANLDCALAIPGGRLTLDGSAVITMDVAGGERAAFRYDALGELVAADVGSRVTSYTYDAAGRLTALVDPSGETTTYEYDALGRTVAAGGLRFVYSDSRLARAVGGGGDPVEYTYDSQANLVEVSENGGDTRFAYDGHRRVTRFDSATGTREYQYDDQDLVSRVEDGETTQFSYDRPGRLVRSADTSGQTVEYQYDSDGSLLRASSDDGVTRFSYDRSGRLTAIAGPDGGVTAFAYDDAGLLSLVLPTVGDDVVVDFEHGDIDKPLVIGAVSTERSGVSFSITLRGRLRTCSACP